MQLPGLGRMMNFHVGPHTEEGSRLDIYMSRCMLELCNFDIVCSDASLHPRCSSAMAVAAVCRPAGTGSGWWVESVHASAPAFAADQRVKMEECNACRARELLNDFPACEAGPSLPVADLRTLQSAAGLVRGVWVTRACKTFQGRDVAVIIMKCCVMTQCCHMQAFSFWRKCGAGIAPILGWGFVIRRLREVQLALMGAHETRRATEHGILLHNRQLTWRS